MPAPRVTTRAAARGAVLTTRALNRALLARQHLLTRASMPAAAMVEHLVAMQAQNPLDPYIALWSRIDGFRPEELAAHVEAREAVRIGLLRTTLHLATADDALALWPVVRPVLDRAWSSSPFRRALDDAEVHAIRVMAKGLLEAKPRTMAELGAALAEQWPAFGAGPLSYVARFQLPIVQVPPRGVWGRSGRATWTTIESWLGRPLADDAAPDRLVVRYLAAFGPATVADVRTWSWLTGLREVVDRLRPSLMSFRDEAGRELLDLPDAPRPDPETPAPPRFLPEYDNALLSHEDRGRIIAPESIGRITGWVGTFLVDGFVVGQWRIDRTPATATLVLQPFVPLGSHEPDVLTEGEGLMRFMAPAADERRIAFGIAREGGFSRDRSR